MVRFEHDGMSLWYGTADAPAPVGNVSAAEEVIISVGATPVDASNSVEVCYRVNQGAIQTVAAKWTRNDIDRKAQYFKASLPNLRVGDTVEYAVLCRCAGRQVPSAEQAKRLEHSFRIVDGATESAKDAQSPNLPQAGGSGMRAGPEVRAAPITSAGVTPPLARSPKPPRIEARVAQPQRASIEAPRVARSLPEPRLRPRLEPEAPSPSVAEVASTMRLERSRELLQALERHGIRTLEDVRKAGGVGHLKGLPVASDHPTVKALEAHAHLSVLSSDVEVNAKLIEKGFASVSTIARVPVEAFIENTKSELDEHMAALLHRGARAKKAFLDNILTSRRLDAANGYFSNTRPATRLLYSVRGGLVTTTESAGGPSARLGDLTKFDGRFSLPEEETCECRDCEAAVSPRAYLADLLAYAVDYRIWKPGAQGGKVHLVLDDLVASFHQPFDKLSASCAAVAEEVRQVRICIEVLRRYLGNRPLSDPAQEEKLKKAEQNYRLQAYSTLLTRIGTSYEELRRARGDMDTAEVLAERLGLDQPNRLNALRLDPFGSAITEDKLETLFGLLATASPDGSPGDPLREMQWQPIRSVRPVLNISSVVPELLQWRLAYLRQQWQDADWTEDMPPLIDPDVISAAHCQSDAARRLWNGHKQWIDCQLNGGTNCPTTAIGLRQITGTPSQRFERMIRDVLDVTPETLQTLADDQEAGNDISESLKELGLFNAAFSYLARMQELATGADLLESEWEEVYNILVQVLKHRLFAQWRTEEKQQGVFLGRQHFRIPRPSLPLRFPPERPDPPPVWRGTIGDRRDWEDRLQSRIDQEQVLIDGLREAVSATEEATLPLLRSALIDATNAVGDRPEARAKWLTDRLLIDAQVSGCQKTTRISQAIQTLQELLWSLRTGQLKDSHPDWELLGRHFDEDWQWLGSYATWRAAMFVYIYPENLLYPTLRKWQSSGFEQLAQNLRLGRRLNPEGAQQLADECAKYYDDVTHLEIETSCQAGTRTYWYGRAPSGACYWSRYDHNNDNPNYAQTSWKKIGSLSGSGRTLKLLGGVPFGGTDDKPEAVLVFAKRKEGAAYKLVVAKQNLADSNFEEEGTELDLPQKDRDFSAVVNQIRTVKEQPWLIVKDEVIGNLYEKRLNTSGAAWVDGIWNAFTVTGATGAIELRAMVPVTLPEIFDQQGAYLLYDNVLIDGTRRQLGYYGLLPMPGHQGLLEEGRWLGAFLWPENETIYAVAESNGNPFLVEIHPSIRDILLHPPPLSSELWAYWAPTHAIDKLTIDSGLPSDPTRLTIAERRKSYSHWAAEILFIESGGLKRELYDLRAWQIVPTDIQSLELAAARPSESQEVRREYTHTFFDVNQAAQGLNPWLRVPASTFAYAEEYYYFVPLFLALELQRRGYYREALDWYRTVYDYTEPDEKDGNGRSLRKIWYGLQFEEGLDHTTYERTDDWLQDPLNPYHIASTRPNTYTRFTLLSLIRCFLEYGDSEFTLDTAESVPRARALYSTALELLDSTVLKQWLDNECDALIRELIIKIGEDERIPAGVKPGLIDLVEELEWVRDLAKTEAAAERINELLEGGGPSTPPEPPISPEEILNKVRGIVDDTRATLPASADFRSALTLNAAKTTRGHAALLAEPEIFRAAGRIRFAVGGEIGQIETPTITGAVPEPAIGEDFRRGRISEAQPRAGGLSMRAELASNLETRTALSGRAPSGDSGERRLLLSPGITAIPEGYVIHVGYIPAPSFEFCIPPNPVLRALRMQAELNLHKIRNCRNIAGIERELEPYAAPTDTVSGLPTIGAGSPLVLPGSVRIPPMLYRYPVLIERAKQLAQHAQQFEAAMLSALEKRDAEYYSLLKARQDVELTRQGIRLQDLRLREAENGVKLAELQQERAQLQVDHYQDLLDAGLSIEEALVLGLQIAAAAHLHTAAGIRQAATFGLGGIGEVGSALAASAAYHQTNASFERRSEEWEFQRNIAEQDVRIGAQQVTLAEDHVRVAGQELRIAEIQAEHAEATSDFLANKFTNAQLYDWMSGILEGVYGFFLQQATAVAKLAERQLAFERQEVPPTFIQADYWEAPADLAIGDRTEGKAPERHGLTGSARLLQDIYQLDQYAFETDKRKLQLTKTISLAGLDLVAFQQFRETGVLRFDTPMDLFDRGFPGHYLRLIKRVRTSVVALIPPIQGIHATLSTLGTSRVVIGPEVFQTVIVQRNAESVALTSPRDATGLFELQQQPEMLLPFEGMGVVTSWEFRMPKASNLFDYSTIADVLVTIEYTALDSYDYRQQVIQELNTRISADRPFSFRHQFADQWWDLHNPEQSSAPMTVRFRTVREDFPPNIEDLKIQHIVLYFARANGQSFEVLVTSLQFAERGSVSPSGGGATSIDGVISTRRGNAGSWTTITDNKSPFGEWELVLPNTEEMRNRFKMEEIEDILFVITYSGRTPSWPA